MSQVRGGSLVPDLTSVRQDIGAFQQRGRQAAAQTSLEEDLRIALGGAPADAAPSKGLSVLGQIAPGIAQAANALLGNRDPQGTEAFRREATQGKALSSTIMKATDFATKQRILADEVGKVSSRGGDVTRLVKLANLSPGELDLELQKMQVVADGMLKAVPAIRPGEALNVLSTPARRNAFARITAANPQIANTLLASRDRQLGRQDQRAQEARIAGTSASQEARADRQEARIAGKSAREEAREERQLEQLNQIFGFAETQQAAPEAPVGPAPTLSGVPIAGDAQTLSTGTAVAPDPNLVADTPLASQPGDIFEGVDPATKLRAQALAILGKPAAALKLIQQATIELTAAERNALAQGLERGTVAFNESVREQTKKIESAEAKELGKGRAKAFAEGRTEAGAASGKLVNLQIIVNASQDPNLYTGSAGPAVLAAKKALGTLVGVDVEGVASGEIIQKAAGALLESAIEVQGRGFSDADRVFHLRQNPGLKDSREGLSIALGMAQRGERHKIQRQQLRESFLATNGNLRGVDSIIRKFDAAYVKKTKDDLAILRTIAKQKKQPSPFAGMNRKELLSIDPLSLPLDQRRQAETRFFELEKLKEEKASGR